jgi:hypothetical protein
MADPKKPLLTVAETSPGVATAAAQKGISKNEVSKIAALVELRNLHNKLTALPQNEAYKQYQGLDKNTRAALTSTFDPKYIKEDKGFIGNLLNSVKSAVYYGGGTTKDLVNNFADVAGGGLIGNVTKIITGTAKGLFNEAKDTSVGEAVTKKTSEALDVLVRPQNKLVKQPYMAARIAEENGGNGWSTLAQGLAAGFKELMPGGEDAVPTGTGTAFEQYWAQASKPENVFDESAVAEFNSELTPAASYLGRLLASKEDLVDSYEQFQDNPGVVELVNRYVAGEPEAIKEVGYAVARFEKSKISPGRDYARAIVSLFPHEAEKAILGDGAAKGLFTLLSAPLDGFVTIGADPTILAGKARRAVMVAKYGFFKVGEGSIAIEKAFTRPAVRKYWDEAGKLIETYRNGDLPTRAQALNRLQDRFPEININVVEDLAKADVRNSEDALTFFDNGQRFVDMMSGKAGIAGKDSLIPRMTFGRGVANEVKDAVSKTLGTERFSSLNVGKTDKEFIAQFSDSPDVWADKIGLEKTGLIFTAKDKSTAAKIDRVVRLFSIAPVAERTISIADGSSATQIYRLARTVLDKTSSGAFRAAWLSADEGQRLLMYKGLLKTLGVGMGLNLSNEGRLVLSKIDDMSKEIYSVSQSAVDIGDLADVLKTVKNGSLASAPRGVRKKTQEAISVLTAEGKASRLIASTNSKISEYTERIKALKADRKDALAANEVERAEAIADEIKITGAKLGRELKTKRELKARFGQADDAIDTQADEAIASVRETYPERMARKKEEAAAAAEADELDSFLVDRFNAGQTLDGTPRAIRQYQLDDYRSLPDFSEWREIAQRAGVFTELFGRATNNHYSKMIADGWSFGNLYPRLGLRSSVEEVGMYGIIGGAEGLGYYIKGRSASRALRAATQPGVKTTVFGNEKTDKNLGIIYDNLYKILGKHYTQEQLLAMADDPVLLGQAVANSMIKNKFRPEFLNTRRGKDVANWAGDFAEFNGKAILDDINGSSVRAERPITEAEEISESLKQFGPSVRFNVQNQEALKGMTFAPEFTEIANMNDKFVFNWLLELNNTVGKRNGQFGNIVLWNAGKKADDVIKKLKAYIETDGKEIAERFAIYAEQGPEGLARAIYLDATYPLRDYAGRINMDLVNAIRNKGGMEKFTIEDLVKLDKPYARPESILGREIVPVTGASAEQVMYRVINSGYGWMGKQIALLDREPITLGNYFMFRNELKGTQEATKKSLMANGLSEEGADSIARFAAHENALGLARNRTLSFVDNGDVRTNLAYSLRTMGRYYRATEDFYRRIARLGKYEKRAIVRLAILNQTFEDNGFIHKDDKGQMYFTYPGDDLFAGAIIKTLSLAGITTYSPVPVNFGGYVKMLTPSLDPESNLPGLSNPFISLSLDAMSNLPYIGEYISGAEKVLTGARNVDIPAWEKAAPANVKRAYNFLAGSTEGTESRFSSAVKAIKLLISTGNGPTKASDLQSFYENAAIQARNVDAVKLVMGQATIASIQAFGNKDIPKELTNAGVFTWDSEFQKMIKKYDGDKDALSKALVQFAKLYPSKLAYTNFATDTTTFAAFRKTIEAEKFVRANEKLLTEHADAGSFFIPVSGQTDLNSYAYLKQKGYISNKPLNPKVAQGKENFIRQVATTGARMAFYQLTDEYNAKIAAAQSLNERRYWRQELDIRKKGLLTAYPLLALQVTPNEESNKRRIEVISDMKSLLSSNKAPDKDLADTFGAMLREYDNMNSTLQRVVGSSDKANEFKKNLRSDTRETILQLAKSSDNATTFFYSVLEPLIGD